MRGDGLAEQQRRDKVRSLSSAQHGDRVDSNPSGLWDQQSGGGSRGVAGRNGVAEGGHAGVAAGKTLGYM